METGIRKHKTNKTPRVTASVKFPHVGKSCGLTKVFSQTLHKTGSWRKYLKRYCSGLEIKLHFSFYKLTRNMFIVRERRRGDLSG